MRKLGIGLIGCGRWGKLLATEIQKTNAATVVAVYNRTFETAKDFAHEIGAKAYSTYQEVIDDPNIQAVLVVTTHNLHEEITVNAAKAKKHVFCDKPLSIDVASCYRMIKEADGNGIKIMCGHNTRLFPIYRKITELVESNVIGTLSAITVQHMVKIERVNWWAKKETMGTFLHSPGIHMIDLMLAIGGKAKSVSAIETKNPVQKEIEYMDTAFVNIEFESGAIGSLQSSVSCLTDGHSIVIVGEKGSITLQMPKIMIKTRDEEEVIDYGEEGYYTQQMEKGNTIEIENFIGWLVHDDKPLLTAWDGLYAVEIIDAAYKSIEERKTIDLPLKSN